MMFSLKGCPEIFSALEKEAISGPVSFLKANEE